MIMQHDAEFFSGVADFFGHVDVVAGWRRITGGVVVDQDDCRGVEFKGAFDDFAQINGRVVYGAALLDFVGDEDIFLVQEQHPELFGFL